MCKEVCTRIRLLESPEADLVLQQNTLNSSEDMLEYVRGTIFPGEEYEREIKCANVALIRIMDPSAPKGTKPLVKENDIKTTVTYIVPAHFTVEVIDGYMKMTKSDSSSKH